MVGKEQNSLDCPGWMSIACMRNKMHVSCACVMLQRPMRDRPPHIKAICNYDGNMRGLDPHIKTLIYFILSSGDLKVSDTYEANVAISRRRRLTCIYHRNPCMTAISTPTSTHMVAYSSLIVEAASSHNA